MIDGTWTDEPHRVKEEVRSFFSQRFQEPDYHRPRLAVGEHQIEEELPKELQAEEQGIQPEQVLVTRMFGPAGAEIPQVFIKWKGRHAEGATWEDRSNMMQQFPAFNLEDKVLFQRGIVRQEESFTVAKLLLRYSRKNKMRRSDSWVLAG